MKLTKLTALAVASGICLFASDLMAWQSKPINYNKCKKDGKTDQRCEKENTEDNLYTFGAELSTDSFKYFNNFTPEEKQQAMSLADGNKMSPDEAVARIRTEK